MLQTNLKPILFGLTPCPQAASFLARTTGLDSKHKNATTKFINGMVANGIWAKLDVLYLFATNSTSNALLNLVSTSFTAVANGAPAFAIDAGYTGVAASSTVYLDTGFNPSTAGGKYAQNSAHISVYSNTNSAATANVNMALVSASSVTATQIAVRQTGDLALFRINDSSPQSAGVAVTSSNGHYIASRTGSSTSFGYINGIDQAVTAVASNTMSNGSIPILAQLVLPATRNGGDARQISAASIGGALTAADAINYYNLLHQYLQVIAGVA